MWLTVVPHFAHAPGRYSPQLEQYVASGSGRGPQAPQERCLNLATAAGIVLFEALRRIDRSV
jgi:tRNA(Leu) C34 or U34 (ribose-2'-O)-methylase TrmL